VSETRVLICGSIAYDTIMVFNDRFRNHILPDKVHMLNVAFTVLEMRREFGGCAGNIAYNLNMLGGAPVMMATIGDDGQPYRERLAQLALDSTHLRTMPGSFTAQAFITTDLDDNQITAFHPGAMGLSHHNAVTDAKDIRLGIIAPDGRDGMLAHARQMHEAGIPFVFDPGQAMPLFNRDELRRRRLGDYLAISDTRARCRNGRLPLARLPDASGRSRHARRRGFQITAGGKVIPIPRSADCEADPDRLRRAYQAGLLHGIAHDWDGPDVLPAARLDQIAQRRAESPVRPRGHRRAAARVQFGALVTMWNP
jgi:adenosine kinase